MCARDAIQKDSSSSSGCISPISSMMLPRTVLLPRAELETKDLQVEALRSIDDRIASSAVAESSSSKYSIFARLYPSL